MPYNVIIADDHLLFTEGLSKIINSIGPYKVVATAFNGEDLLKLLNGVHNPDLLILDICMPQLNGIETGKRIRQQFPNCKILVCTMYHTKNIKEQIMVFHPQGLISKAIDAPKLEEVLESIISGKTYFENTYFFENSCADKILSTDNFYQLQKLTDREKEIITLTKQGLSAKAIAQKLQLSVNTINNHKANIYQKLGINNSVELVKFAFNANL